MATLKIPVDVKYAKSDEWVKLESGEAIMGISDSGEDARSDVVDGELPEGGKPVAFGKRFGTVESFKAASDLNALVSGTITAVNKALEDEPETVNKDPFGAGWFI